MNLPDLIQSIGYVGVTAIVFAESGLLIGFFLPGDSLLFTAGFLASQGVFNIWLLMALLIVAAITGDSVGYTTGRRFGRRLFNKPDSRFFKRENLLKAEQFYAKHGGKTIILARFIPVIRTFAPIVAGVSQMTYGKFLTYNIVGGLFWVLSVTGLGYWLGGKVEGIDRYLIPTILLIIILSVAPGMYHMLRTPAHRQTVREKIQAFLRRKSK